LNANPNPITPEFKKPEQKLYTRFLYLNGDEVINSLSALEGGDVDEVLTRQGEEGTGELGGEIDAKVLKGKAGKKRARRFEEEMRRKRTVHSATSTLLRKLREANAIGVIGGDYDATVYEQLEEHMLIEFQAGLRIHPAHQTVSAGRAWIKNAGTFGATKEDIANVRTMVQIMEVMTGSGVGDKNTFLAFAETAGTQDGHRLAFPVEERNLLVPLEDFSGRASFVAQVDRILGEGEQLLALRLMRDVPPLRAELETMSDAVPGLLTPMRELGIQAELSDFALEAPTVVLKPICIYK